RGCVRAVLRHRRADVRRRPGRRHHPLRGLVPERRARHQRRERGRDVRRATGPAAPDLTTAMRDRLGTLARRFARLTTRAVFARPVLWRVFRFPLRKQFDAMASSWEGRRGPEALVPLGAALERLERPPARVLDLGTGTGKGARVVAKLFPDAEVVGVDLSGPMIEEARRL